MEQEGGAVEHAGLETAGRGGDYDGEEIRNAKRMVNCFKTNWGHDNINQNSKKYYDASISACGTSPTLDDCILQKYRASKVNDELALCKSESIVFRGMNNDFYNEQGGYLSAKCNDCDTTVKYHIRQGNQTLPIGVTYEECGEPQKGTATNFISFSHSFITTVGYALTKYSPDRESVLSDYGVIIYFNTRQTENTKWYCPSENLEWFRNEANQEFEIKNDPAYNKPCMSITGDWLTNDSEILLKIPGGRMPFDKIGRYDGGIIYVVPEPTEEDELRTLPEFPKHVGDEILSNEDYYRQKYKININQLKSSYPNGIAFRIYLNKTDVLSALKRREMMKKASASELAAGTPMGQLLMKKDKEKAKEKAFAAELAEGTPMGKLLAQKQAEPVEAAAGGGRKRKSRRKGRKSKTKRRGSKRRRKSRRTRRS